MKPENIAKKITTELAGVAPKNTWGETSFFYNPGLKLPNGVYFCTIKEKDGANDKSSKLSRAGVYRLSIGVPKEIFEDLFGIKPPRPAKGCIINTGHDFSKINELTPHPIYGWMSWVSILSPTDKVFQKIYPLIEAAHQNAITKFDKKF